MSPLPGIAGVLLLLGAHAAGAAAQVSNNVIATEPNEALGPAVADEFALTTNGHFAVQRRESSVDMRIDGRLDETAWQDLQAHDDFRVIDPDTLEPASLPTEVVLFYTDKGLYVGARMTQDPDTLVEYLSGRDQGFLNRDYFSFTLDTSGEGRYGFWFQLNLGDTKSDGTILPERQYSSSWDGAWRGATARSDEGWSAEFFVPWSLVNMPKANGTRTMGIFAQRKVAHSDERHAWPPLPWTKPKFMSEFQQLALSEVSPRQQYGIIPYASAGYDRFGGGTTRRSGVDVFWRPSSNFQLTSTLNPDFGNVEAEFGLRGGSDQVHARAGRPWRPHPAEGLDDERRSPARGAGAKGVATPIDRRGAPLVGSGALIPPANSPWRTSIATASRPPTGAAICSSAAAS